jgi:hypothetical protein
MELSQAQMDRMIRENSDASLGGHRIESRPEQSNTPVELGSRAASATVEVANEPQDADSEATQTGPARKIKRMPSNGSFA